MDVVVGSLALAAGALPAGVAALLIWLQDRHSPFYVAPRVAAGGSTFSMIKLRSMRVGADKTGVASTKVDDPRITALGAFVRKSKLDEVPQLWNVIRGDMSLVGPRPNVPSEVRLYTEEERRLLTVRPGITDFASIVFADEGEILRGSDDPDLGYHQLIRPGKSRLALLYLDHRRPLLMLSILGWTVLSAFDRRRALAWVAGQVQELGGGSDLARLASRRDALEPAPPPGANDVVWELPRP